MNDQAHSLRRLANRGDRKSARVIAVTSGKGGVGKTNLSVNLSLGLIQAGSSVVLLDADLGMANVDILLGLTPKFTLTDVLQSEKDVGEIIVEGPLGLKVVAGGSGVYDVANLTEWDLERFVRSVEQLDLNSDFIIIDTGAGLGRNVLSFVLAADETIVVTTPEPTAITDAYGMIKVILQRNPDSAIRVIVNMVNSPRQAQQVVEKLNAVLRQFVNREVAYGGFIPYDGHVGRAVSEQRAFITAFPSSSASRSIEHVAEKIAGKTSGQDGLGRGLKGFFSRVYNLIH